MESKTNYNRNLYWIFGLTIGVIVVWFILYKIFWDKIDLMGEIINLVCGIASLCGVFLALIQIQQAKVQISSVSEIAEATNKAVLDNKREIREFLSFAEMGHLIEIIKNTQNYIRKKDYSSAVILMQEIKDDLLRADSQFSDLLKLLNIDMTDHIKKISIDIDSLVSNILQVQNMKDSTLKPMIIHANLEDAREIVIKIEQNLKQEKV